MKYKKGDKVLIVNERTFSMAGSGSMDKYLGSVMTIHNTYERIYYMIEDGGYWCWYDHDIQGKIVGNKLVRVE